MTKPPLGCTVIRSHADVTPCAHWLAMLPVPSWAIALPILIRYQSTDTLKPRKKVGLNTTPAVSVLAFSACKLTLPVVKFVAGTETPLKIVGPVVIAGGLNSSRRFGARVSSELVIRNRTSLIGL